MWTRLRRDPVLQFRLGLCVIICSQQPFLSAWYLIRWKVELLRMASSADLTGFELNSLAETFALAMSRLEEDFLTLCAIHVGKLGEEEIAFDLSRAL